MDKKIGFIGAGSMAESVISGIVNAEILPSEHIMATNKSNQERLDKLESDYRIRTVNDTKQMVAESDIIILATKPHDVEATIDSIKEVIKDGHMLISVSAGIPTDYISSLIGNQDIPIIRAMPNTSAAVRQSATAIAAGKYADEAHVKETENLFNTIGSTTIVKEEDMHTVTGVSGSGPAYFYYMVEAMEKAAVESGLAEETARELITQTVVGVGAMLQYSEEPASELRKKIMSPNGTTQAGIEALQHHNFEDLIIECVKTASQRSRELGDGK
ncbi:pyrroline-5-carboxylate reductase [Virgibacillus xinjiangensis]|uniref:Pyrroline-5-carboxylate reductase n=1 Tax=Virgibacillus xinjiangensis TaxID=393090 RepID=A0ABV7CXT4_9BACI